MDLVHSLEGFRSTGVVEEDVGTPCSTASSVASVYRKEATTTPLYAGNARASLVF
jgi:hypothetical protein